MFAAAAAELRELNRALEARITHLRRTKKLPRKPPQDSAGPGAKPLGPVSSLLVAESSQVTPPSQLTLQECRLGLTPSPLKPSASPSARSESSLTTPPLPVETANDNVSTPGSVQAEEPCNPEPSTFSGLFLPPSHSAHPPSHPPSTSLSSQTSQFYAAAPGFYSRLPQYQSLQPTMSRPRLQLLLEQSCPSVRARAQTRPPAPTESTHTDSPPRGPFLGFHPLPKNFRAVGFGAVLKEWRD